MATPLYAEFDFPLSGGPSGPSPGDYYPTTPPATPYTPLQPYFRDQMDARRAMWRRTPEAEYPSGYLGTIKSRREDRLLDAVQYRLNRRAYDRGVHKGERIDQTDYFWGPEFNEWSGLEAQAAGVRQAPIQTVNERLVNDGKNPLPRGSGGLAMAPKQVAQVMDPHRHEQLRQLLPTWR